MKLSQGFTRVGPSIVTIVAVTVSFALLSIAMRTLPLGTAYTIWTGIGAVGASSSASSSWANRSRRAAPLRPG